MGSFPANVHPVIRRDEYDNAGNMGVVFGNGCT